MTRTSLAVTAVVLLVLGAGCLGFVTGSEPLEFSASPATVTDDARTEAGYQENAVEAQPLERDVTVAGQQRTVKVTNHVARYGREVDLGPLGQQELGVFVVLSTPEVEVLGRTFNPVGDMSNRELLQRLQGNYQSLEVGDRVGTTQVQVLGEDTALETYDGTASVEGREVDIRIRITRVTHEGDYVIAVGLYPAQLSEESGRIETLVEGITHGGA